MVRGGRSRDLGARRARRTRTPVIRPGPHELPAHIEPGGLVLHVYDTDGLLLLERHLAVADADRLTTIAATDAIEAVDASRTALVLVVYDGDSGARWTQHEWRAWQYERIPPE
jgi:hypothetical protein